MERIFCSRYLSNTSTVRFRRTPVFFCSYSIMFCCVLPFKKGGAARRVLQEALLRRRWHAQRRKCRATRCRRPCRPRRTARGRGRRSCTHNEPRPRRRRRPCAHIYTCDSTQDLYARRLPCFTTTPPHDPRDAKAREPVLNIYIEHPWRVNIYILSTL